MPPLQVVWSIGGIVLIIVAAYYVTYFIGVKSQGISRGKTQNIQLVDRFAISRDKSFCLVEVSGNVYLVAITNQSMTLIDKIDSAAFAEFAAERGGTDIYPGKPLHKAGQQGFPDNNLISFVGGKIKEKLSGKKAGDYSDNFGEDGMDKNDFQETLRRAGSAESNKDDDSEVPKC